MNETTWHRLWRIAEARREHLGITRTGLTAAGGPSSEWVRKLQAMTGKPSPRHTASLRALDKALGWPEGTSRSLLNDDRSGWSEAVLADEEHQLITEGAPAMTPQPASLVRRLTDLLRSDAMATLTEGEWEELLAAVEARQPKRAKTRGRKVSGQ